MSPLAVTGRYMMTSVAKPRTTTRRPNILVIVSDDHGYADRSALGVRGDVSTPALDRLAAEGVTCTDAYVTAPICSPSRAALIAGSYQQRWGAQWFDTSEIGGADFPTVAERLRDEGYATGYFGKIHYGTEQAGDRGTPPEHGFDESFYGLAGQSMGRLNYLHHSNDAIDAYGEEAAARMAVQPLWESREPVEYEGFLTAEIARRARRFIADHDDQPFFAMVAFNAVHNFCWQLPQEELKRRGLPPFEDWHPGAASYIDWYDGAISPNLPNGRAYYLAQLELMDAEIGAFLDQLEQRGRTEDTLVIYTTDNGGSTCNYGVNEPLRGTKYTLWEGGVRVPFIVRWPGSIPAGQTHTGLVSSMDILPTALAAAGAPVADAATDGLDQLPYLRGASGGHAELHWDCAWQWAVREGDWKLQCVDGSSAVAEQIRRVEHADPGDGLILTNLADDPRERHNVAAAHPDIVERLAALHDAWRVDVRLSTYPNRPET
jgi:arylsulfatase A-like enzyme